MAERERLFLIDGAHTLYRSYHAIRELATSDGFPSNALYGFVQTLQKVIREYDPEYLAVAFDLPGPTFRHELYPEYKANRPPAPEDLVVQIPWIKKILEAYRIPCVEKEGYEGDDVMGTLARQAREGGLEAVLVSGDKDLHQLVGPGIKVLEPRKGLLMGPEEIAAQYGIPPVQLPDLFALTGDKVDNLPGVPGVGPKTAAALLQQFGSLEEIIGRAEEIEKPKIRKSVQENVEKILKTRELVEVDCRVPLGGLTAEDLRRSEPDVPALRELFVRFEFNRFLEELPTERKLSDTHYRTVRDEAAFEELLDLLARSKEGFALDLETTSKNPMLAEPVGLSFAVGNDRAFYVPVGHKYLGAPDQLPLASVLERLRPMLAHPGLPKFGQNIKYDLLVLKRQGVRVEGVAFDTMIASYILDPSVRGHGLDDLALTHLDHKMISYEEVAGKKGASQIGFDEVEVEKAAVYSCEDAHATYMLTRILEEKIQEEEFEHLFHEVEIPLIEVLTEMEFVGVKIDVDHFQGLSSEFREELAKLGGEIHELAGGPFNINSPQQLGKILFEKLKLSNPKKTKTGYGTDVKVLTRLAAEHPLPRLVLAYRSLSKLLSTYVEALPRMIHPETGRIHTSFNQAVTATGRLSSSDPNLQNIPIRTPDGRRIRQGFVPEKGMWMLSADYSQIELRILAQISGDEQLREAFQKEQDVHGHTASLLFECKPEEVTEEMRRRAKVINFGVIYGMGQLALADQLGITRDEARAFIDQYFQTYEGVKAWREDCLRQAREKGYVTTLLNRRRYVREISSANAGARSFAERTAINTPIQGTAADMIKVAMIRIFRRMREQRLQTRMLLQVHDELVFEVPEEEMAEVQPLIREEMEGVMSLDVPMRVDMESGKNWAEAH
jgi:DNA polymerase-1